MGLVVFVGKMSEWKESSAFRLGIISYHVTDLEMTPVEIQSRVEDIAKTAYEDPNSDYVIVTTNRTVLDMCRNPERHDDVVIGYHQVLLPGKDGAVRNLLEIHPEDWLASFSIGDLYEYGEFDR